jgi:hypothetical protein
VSVILVLFNAIPILIHLVKEPPADPMLKQTEVDCGSVKREGSSPPPDVYYIILDDYAGVEQMKLVFNYDNSPFADHLRKEGFYIASKSRTSATSTARSLAASLNMQKPIIDPAFIAKKPSLFSLTNADANIAVNLGIDLNREYRALHNLIRNNRVVKLFKCLGYKYVLVGSDYAATMYSKYADLNVNTSGFKLENELSTTILYASIFRLYFTTRDKKREEVIDSFTRLSNLPGMKGPKFVFAHIQCPHTPLVFGPNGEKVDTPFHSIPERKQQYFGQHIFTTRQAQKLIDEILSKSEKPPIIIIQSDHGFRVEKPTARMIFNAYHLPNGGNRQLWDSITPANSFRVIFNYYFGAHFEMTPDETDDSPEPPPIPFDGD